MFDSDKTENELLDRAGRMVLRAAIDEEQRRREDPSGWLSILFVARQAVPAMALVALLAAILTVWSAQFGAPVAPVDDDAFFGAPGAGVEQTVLADRNGLPPDEVFNIVVDRNYERGAR